MNLLQSGIAGREAFRGELVPQNPNDEPASVLLERVRQERQEPNEAIQEGRRKSGSRKRTTKSTDI